MKLNHMIFNSVHSIEVTELEPGTITNKNVSGPPVHRPFI